MTVKPAYLRFVLPILLALELYAELIHWPQLMFFTKPLLLPLIALYYFVSIQDRWSKVHTLMMFAFLFSWFGDVSLMLTPETVTDTELMGIPKSKYMFLAGVGSFLVAQLLFINVYRLAVDGTSAIKRITFLPFILYWAIMLMLVVPAIYNNSERSPAAIPVVIYATTLVSMAGFALNRLGKTNPFSFLVTLVGACIFVISDSLIAINFLVLPQPTRYAGFSIMLTYVVAEFMIAEGILRHDNNPGQ